MRRIPAPDQQLELGETVELSDDAAHYARDVLRLARGTVVEVFDTSGRAFSGPIISLDPLVVELRTPVDRSAAESPCRITLCQAIAKKDRFEWLLEKATELGVTNIVALRTARGVVRIKRAKEAAKLQRWQRICDEAARQCGRAVSPGVGAPLTLGEALDGVDTDLLVALDPGADTSLVDTVDRDCASIAVFVGPEGGFDEDEMQTLRDRATCCRLGPRVLRTETAGVTAAAVIQALTGGLR